MVQSSSAGASHYPASLNRFSVRHGGAKTPIVTESAPSILQHNHFEGATAASSIRPPPTEISRGELVYSQGGTACLFPPKTIDPQLRSLRQDLNYAAATMKWVNCLDSLPWVRGTSPSEPSSMRPKPSDATTGLCEYCATARILKELEQSMANDQDKTPPTDDDKDHYFPNLPHSGSGSRIVGSA